MLHLAEPGGPSISLRNELAWLAQGGPLEVVAPGPGRIVDEYAAFAEVAVLEYSTLTVPSRPVEFARLARALVRDVSLFRGRIRASRPRRIIAVTTALPALVMAARAEGVPALVYAAEIVPTSPGLRRRVGGALVRRLTRRSAAAIVSCSETVAAQFVGRGAPPLVTAYPPIGHRYATGDGVALRARLGIGDGEIVLATVGNISPGRGQDVAIRALARLRERFPAARLVVAGASHPRSGDIAYRDGLFELAASLGIGDAVVFPGFVAAVADVYAAADAIVNPARREAFGRVAAEALVAGTPVVSTRAGAVPEVLRDGVDALLVAPDDPEAMAAAVARLLEEPQLAGRLVAAGARRVLSEFSEERSLERFATAVAALPPCRSAARS